MKTMNGHETEVKDAESQDADEMNLEALETSD